MTSGYILMCENQKHKPDVKNSLPHDACFDSAGD